MRLREATYPETSFTTVRAILILPPKANGQPYVRARVACGAWCAPTVSGHTTSLFWSETEKEEVSGALGGMARGR